LNYRTLGKTGLKVSEIGLGTAQIGGPVLIGGKLVGSPPIPKSEAINILKTAYENGINFYDTSDKYGDGKAERLIGEAFESNRDEVIIATKCGLTSSGRRNFERQYIRKCLEKSLDNLNTDYIDVFQLTKPNIQQINKGEIYQILNELKDEGKIRFSGISTGDTEETKHLISHSMVDTLQIFYNLLFIPPSKDYIKDAHDKGIGLIVRSPFSSGVLTGKISRETKFSDGDDRKSFLYGKTLESRLKAIELIKKHYNLETSDMIGFSLNYLLSNKYISTIIPGVSRVEQLNDILKAMDCKRLDDGSFSKLECFVSKIHIE